MQDAKDKITNLQKQISEQKKQINQNLRHYKPQIDIYKQMRVLENKAYLYDSGGYKEYEKAYLEYKELSDRLWNAYGKTIEDVSSFYEDQQDQLTYAKAQSEELSLQYKALISYEKEKFKVPGEEMSFFDAVGHSKARAESAYGVFASRLAYITAEDNTETVVRVVTTPDIVEGKNTVTTTVCLLSSDGEVLEDISSAHMSAKEFNKAVNELKYQYGFMQCKVHGSEEAALKQIGKNKISKPNKVSEINTKVEEAKKEDKQSRNRKKVR